MATETASAPTKTYDFCSEKQYEFVRDSESSAILYSGAFRAGKSYGLALKSLATAWEYPGRYAIVTRKTHASLGQSTLRIWKEMFPTEWYSYNQSEHIWSWVTGSIDYFIGCDNGERIKSAQADLVLVDQAEELKEDSWLLLESRLNVQKMPHGQIAAVCNPEGRGHWLYKMAFEQAKMRVLKTKTLDNVFLPDDYIKRLSRFTGKFRQRNVEGEWVGMEGIIYDCYDPRLSVIPRFEIPKEWPRIVGIDFGYENPFCAIWLALDVQGKRGPENSWYAYRELYGSHTLAPEWARQVQSYLHWEPVEAIYADHDAGERAQFRAAGVHTRPAKKDVRPGIDYVYSLLEPTTSKDGTDRPHLYFFDDLLVREDQALEADGEPTSVLGELTGYEWLEAKEGRNAKEEPKDWRNHGADALRYALYSHKKAILSPEQVFRFARA